MNLLYRETYTLHFAPETTIQEVKTEMNLLSKLESLAQIPLFVSKKLEDECSLADNSIGEGSIVHLVRRQPGGTTAPHRITFPDISDTLDLRKKIHLTEPAPPDGVNSPGTNTECACNYTPTHRASCKKAFNTLAFSQAFFTCPTRGESDSITPITVRFWRCK